MRPSSRRLTISAVALAAAASFAVPQEEPGLPPAQLSRLAPDRTFGQGGSISRGDAARLRMSEVSSVRLDSQGRIVLAGSESTGHRLGGVAGEPSPRVARLLADGSLDDDFSHPEYPVVMPPWLGRPRGMLVDGRDRIILVGRFVDFDETFVAVRLTPDGGQVDGDFGDWGFVRTDPAADEEWRDARLAPDGESFFVLTGDPVAPSLLRVHWDGSPDPAFGGGAAVPLDAAPVADLAVDPSGGVVLAQVDVPDPGVFVEPSVVRVTAAGLRDLEFGTGGVLTWPDGSRVHASAVEIDSAGRIVVLADVPAGRSGVPHLARFLQDGTPDASFSGDGREPLLNPVPGDDFTSPSALAVGSAEGSPWALLMDSPKCIAAVRPDAPRTIGSWSRPGRLPGSFFPTDLQISDDGASVVAVGRLDRGHRGSDPAVVRVDLRRQVPVPLPDLRIEWVSAVVEPSASGTRILVTLRIRNEGRTRSVPSSGRIALDDAGPEGGPYEQGFGLSVKSVGAGRSRLLRIELGFLPEIDLTGRTLVATITPSTVDGDQTASAVSAPLQ